MTSNVLSRLAGSRRTLCSSERRADVKVGSEFQFVRWMLVDAAACVEYAEKCYYLVSTDSSIFRREMTKPWAVLKRLSQQEEQEQEDDDE